MHYRCVVLDPPWSYRDKLTMEDGQSAESNYTVMDLTAIKQFMRYTPANVIHGAGRKYGWTMLEDLIAEDAHLWCWLTNPFLVDGTGPDVVRSFGFEPKQLITWVKGSVVTTGGAAKLRPRIGLGHYTRGATEHMIFAVRGKNAKRMVVERNVPNVFVAPVTRHSAKPDQAFDLIRRVSPGPALSIFERHMRPGFDCIGDEIDDRTARAA